jgi:hypothetical protein
MHFPSTAKKLKGKRVGLTPMNRWTAQAEEKV